jgi:beta-glucosidase
MPAKVWAPLWSTLVLAGCGGGVANGGAGAEAGADEGCPLTEPSDSSPGGSSSGSSSGFSSAGLADAETYDGSAADTDGAPPSATKMTCPDGLYADPWTPGYPAGAETAAQAPVEQLLPSMSVGDLAGQMRGMDSQGGTNFADIFRSPDNTQRGIRGWRFRDGARGVVLASTLPAGALGYSTAFPVPESRAAAFDMNLEEQIGEAIGDEVLASGSTLLFAPVINILRHPAWGRAQETYGEDSFVLGRLGTAFVTGAQMYVPACAKHFAANNIENNRMSDDAVMDEQTLREEYARHFGVVIEDAGVACIMAAYNLVNGVYATENRHLLFDILRGDFNFQGFTVSDAWALPGGTAQVNACSLKAGALAGVTAGLDVENPWSYDYAELESAVAAGHLQQSELVTSASRVLQQKFRFNVESLATPPSKLGLKTPTTMLDSTYSIANGDAHVALAEQAAVEGTVLLKNEGSTLPINTTSVHKIAVIGASVPYSVVSAGTAGKGTIAFATNVRLGDLGSSRVFSDPAKSSSPFQGLQALAPSGVTVVSGTTAADAAGADFIVAIAGLTPQDEGEEYTGAGDRSNLDLDGKAAAPIQNPLIESLIALRKPMVVVLEGGSVINMPWLSQVPAVVMAFYPGMAGGDAIAKLLYGQANFGGKLPFTWPSSWNDEPVFADPSGTTRMGYDVGYQYFDRNNITPLYAFGHGLSYTTFAYSNLALPCSTVTARGVVYVTTDVTNTGAVAGDEVAFLFVSYPGHSERRHVKDLEGFTRVTLLPGETKRVTFPIRVADLRYWEESDAGASGWQPASGTIKVMVGPSADNLPLTDTMTVH